MAIDPIEETKQKDLEAENRLGAGRLDIGNLTADDFKAVPKTAVRFKDEFAGYPFQKVRIDNQDFVSAHIVALSPDYRLPVDPSSPNPVRHSRCIRDFVEGRNTDVVFDRSMMLADGKSLFYAVVPSHNVRAQLVFRYNNKLKRVEEDTNYRLLDIGQVNRLRSLFDKVHNNKLAGELRARRFEKDGEGVTDSVED